MAKTPIKDPKQEDLIEKIEEITQDDNLEQQDDTVLEAEDEEQEPDATVALREQIDALKKSEDILKKRAETWRQEAQDAQRTAQERATEITKVRKDSVQAQADSINTALASAQAEAESAKTAIKMAIQTGDVDAQTDAYERLAVTQANIANLQAGKMNVEARLKAPAQEEQRTTSALPQRVQRWLQRHPDYMSDPKKNDKLRAFHWDVIDEGHDFDSDEYIESMETKLGLRKAQASEEEEIVEETPVRQVQKRSPQVSAPVSRESTSNSGTQSNKINLSAAQREAAKVAGVTEKVYAENLKKMNEMKANGSYGGQP